MSQFIPRQHWRLIVVRLAMPWDQFPDGAHASAERLNMNLLVAQEQCFAVLDDAHRSSDQVPHQEPYRGVLIVPCACAAFVGNDVHARVN